MSARMQVRSLEQRAARRILSTDYRLLDTDTVHELAERLLKTIRKLELIKPGDRVAAAVSGGADSVALLLLLRELRAELGIVLSVAHVNHKLRGEESGADERFVADLAQRHSLELHSKAAPLSPTQNSGIEAAARELRYDVFRQVARENRVSKIATAHTLDDQAETVLLRMLRGTGIRGLSAIHPRLVLSTLEDEQGRAFGEVVRPLLTFRRAELQDFLRQQHQPWREDSSNRDLSFLRNRVRHRLLPALHENFGSSAIHNLADLAEIARAEEEHWKLAHPEIRVQADFIEIARLLSLPLASQRRLIRAWLETRAPKAGVSFRLIEDLLNLALSAAGKTLELPFGYRVRRTRDRLCLEPPGDRLPKDEYEYSLPVPGEVEVPELSILVQAAVVDPGTVPESERDFLLDPSRLPDKLTVRNWRPGDRFWPAHSKELKKVKDLLNDRHITGLEKTLWPVIASGAEDLVWMRAFPVPARLQPPAGSSRALQIREVALP
jgi:tRNA(Ile)-lysidine synthase